MTVIRVLDVKDLGWDFAMCEIEGETVLLVDTETSHDERMKVMADAMAGEY